MTDVQMTNAQTNESTSVQQIEQPVELMSKDGQSVQVDRKWIEMSGLVKDMLDDGDEDEDDVPSVPVPNVDMHILKRVIDYCRYHHNNRAEEIEKPLKGVVEDVICDWDKNFLKDMDQSVLVELIMAANYLNIKDLLDLTCAKVASLIKGKSPEQIREMFGIENDFTPEEEAKIVRAILFCLWFVDVAITNTRLYFLKQREENKWVCD
jgi:S-phase kinase-associated protein 1